MDKYNDVSFKVVPSDEECVVNAVQIGKRIEEPPHTIRCWADEFQDFLYIKKINGRWQYTETSVSQFKIIKTLRRDKNLSIAQIKDLIKKNGFKNHYDADGGVEARDTFDIEYITAILTQSNEKLLTAFMNALVNQQAQYKADLLNSIRQEVSIAIQENLEVNIGDLTNKINEKFENQDKKLEKQDKKSDEILNQIQIAQDNFDKKEFASSELVTDLRDMLKERKREIAEQKEKEQDEKKHWWQKMLKK